MPSPLAAIKKAIVQLSAHPRSTERAVSRAEALQDLVPNLELYHPRAIARSTLELPNARKGFSEDMTTQIPPVEATLIRPSEFLSRTPPLDSARDEQIVQHLMQSIQSDRLKELPILKIDEFPEYLEAGFEGRHRMKALRNLRGDDPVLMNLLQGDKFGFKDTPWGRYQDYISPSSISPLELLQREVMWGDTPTRINPLWTRLETP